MAISHNQYVNPGIGVNVIDWIFAMAAIRRGAHKIWIALLSTDQ